MQPLADAVEKALQIWYSMVSGKALAVLHVDVVGAVHPLDVAPRGESAWEQISWICNGSSSTSIKNVLDLDQVKSCVYRVGPGYLN